MQVKGTDAVGSSTQNFSNTLAAATKLKPWQIIQNASSGAAAHANAISANAQAQQFSNNWQGAQFSNDVSWDAWQAEAEFNAAEAQKNRDWQERMANTAYQRAVKDMIKAGINPILASQLGGAATGSGSVASVGSFTGAQPTSGNYTGQMENMNTTLAILGVMMSAIAEMANSSQSNTILASLLGRDSFDVSYNAGRRVKNNISNLLEGILPTGNSRPKTGNLRHR